MIHYCTYFDSNYLLRGLTLYRSLQAHAGEFTLWVLCCDAATARALRALGCDNLRAVALEAVEAFEPRLAGVKPQRSRAEYLWTLSPIWPLFLLETQPQIEMITYLDADLFFFASPQPLWDEIGANSIAMFSHRFPSHNRHLEENGIYNVGWVSFRRDANGLACLGQWREQCLEWCYERLEAGRYGDQKYLDAWPQEFDGVRVIEHAGAGVAPWNWQTHPVERRAGRLYVGEVPLIFFHFHGLKFLTAWLYDAVFTGHAYGALPPRVRQRLYGEYLVEMQQTARWARSRGVAVSFGAKSWRSYLQADRRRLLLYKVRRRQLGFRWGLK